MKPHFKLSAFLAILLSSQLSAATKNWFGGSGNWNNGTNWVPTGVPGPADTVIITSGVVTLDIPVTVEKLVISGATVQGTNDLGVTGDLTMNAISVPCRINCVGNVSISGNVTMVNSGIIATGSLIISGDLDLGGSSIESNDNSSIANISGMVHVHKGVLNVPSHLRGISMTCNGGLSHEEGSFTLIENAVLNIPAGQEYLVVGNNLALLPPPNGPSGTVNIEGTFHKMGGGEFESSLLFNNMGTVQIDNGTLSLRNGSTSSGLFNFASGCTIDFGQHYGSYDFNGATFTSAGTSSFIGYAGTINFNSGTINLSNFNVAIHNAVNINCDLIVQNFNNHTNGTTTVNQSIRIGGTFTNDGILINNGIIKGNGTLVQNNVFNINGGSSIAPGLSPGKLTVTGGLNLGSGTYDCEINGTIQGTNYDWLAVSGPANLANASLLIDWGGFTPSPGTFTIMTFTSHNGVFASVTIPPVAGLDFTVGYSSTQVFLTASVLPVRLVRFTVGKKDEGVQLDWHTASEVGSERFEIEHSLKGKQWEIIGSVNGNGTTSTENNYTYFHDKVTAGSNCYRLKQIDFDGRHEYSNILCVQIDNYEILAFPNPARALLLIKGVRLDTDFSFRIVDKAGNLKMESKASNGQIDLSELSQGVYFLLVYMDEQVFIERIIKE